VVAHQMPFLGDTAGELWEGLHPSALEEDGRGHPQPRQLVEDPCRVLAVVRAVGVLGVEREGDARGVDHFSTPVMTMPRMNAFCAMKKMIIGRMIVMSVAACTSSGLLP